MMYRSALDIMKACLLILAITSLTGAHAEDITVITNTNLIPMTSDTVIEHQNVIVRGSRIAAIEDANRFRMPESAVVIDGTGLFLMPGLADMHVHLGLNDWLTPDVNLYLANGVTTVRDLTQGIDQVNSIKSWCDDFNSKRRLGPTVYNAWTIFGNESHIMETVPLIKANGYNCLKVNDYLSRSDFFDVIRSAQKSGIYVLGHIAYPVTIDDVVSSGLNELSHVELIPLALINSPGFDTLSKERWGDEFLNLAFGLIGPIHDDPSGNELRRVQGLLTSAILKLKATPITITTTIICDEAVALKYVDIQKIASKPYSFYLPQRFWNDMQRGNDKNAYFRGKEWAAEIFYGLVTYSLREIRKCGIPIVAGTDTGPAYMGIVPGFSLHEELQLLVDCGYSPYEALSAATRDASHVIAKMTGKDEFGTIEVGKRADLILLKGNPLLDIKEATAPVGVMTAGVWLPRNALDELLAVRRQLVSPILREVELKTGSADSVIASYRNLCKQNRNNGYYISHAVLGTIGYDFLFLGRPDEAIKIFSLNAEQYPYAANSYDCLAEAYLKKGEKELAIATYRKALNMDPGFDNARKALQKLTAGVP
jgi:tetratricopeptide (TPR) repeat protein